MKIAILTIFPEMFDSLLSTSILGRARADGLLTVEPMDIRPFSVQKHKNTDDYPFGGGAGMVMTPQPIVDAVEAARSRGFAGPCLYMSPRGKPLTQAKVRELAGNDGLILLCGHYEGVDQRALDLVVDEEVSLGDFVLTGGELAAMAVVDAVARLVPGVLGSSDSAEDESFSDGLLEYPQYTRPREYRGLSVPEVLLNGDHAKINAWRRKQALAETLKRRPDLFQTAPMTDRERAQTLEAVRAEVESAKTAGEASTQTVLDTVSDTQPQAVPEKTIAGETAALSSNAKAKRAIPEPQPASEPAVAEAGAAIAESNGQAPIASKAKAKRAKPEPQPASEPAVAEAGAAIAESNGQTPTTSKAKAKRTKPEPQPASEPAALKTGTTIAESNGQAPIAYKAKAKRAKPEPQPASEPTPPEAEAAIAESNGQIPTASKAKAKRTR